MAVNIRKYIENPGEAFGARARKMRARLERNMKLSAQFLAGNYTGRTLDIKWTGKPSRVDLINALIKANGCKKYLEIGCRDDECFRVVGCDYKVGVDPASGGTHRMTSDEFFAQNQEKFDLIFIDGLHEYSQVAKDIVNAARALNPGGTIVMHDCLPTSCLAQYDFPVIDAWNGDTWKAFVEARTMPDLDAALCLIDHGVGVIKKRRNSHPLMLQIKNFKKLKFSFLLGDYTGLLNALDYQQTLAFATEGKRSDHEAA